MKLHLPLFLRKAILALMLAYGVPAVHAADLTLGAEDSLSVDYSASGSLLDLNNGTLRLSGGTTLQLSSCGEGDGKTYILLTGVSELLDAQGNVISLDSTNNAASRYFDASQPGSSFWAAGTLQLNHGALQLVLHNETVKDAITITTRQENPSAYQYYAGVSFENIEYVSGSCDVYGGAIYGGYDSTITLRNNGSVEFEGNTASSSSAYGGAIYGDEDSTITLSDNGSVVFEGNTASASSSSSYYSSAYGGAIYGGSSSTIMLSNNGSVTFSGNTASSSSSYYYSYAYGGAIYGGYDSTIMLSGNGSVSFSGNTASSSSFYHSYASGGAIYGDTITLSDNGSVSFIGNTASSSSNSSAYGGAIYGARTITLSNNGSVSFIGNTASSSYHNAYGGAIYGGSSSTITLSNNGSVTFSGNTASAYSDYSAYGAYGGAIFGYGDSTITLSDNGSVVFEGNTASASYSDYYSSSAYGGAIYGGSSSTITLSNNGSVSFIGNTASASAASSYYSFSAYGGAIYGDSYSTITLSNNGSVVFEGNTASASSSAYGGAIYGDSYSTITLSNNGSVVFEGNTASASASSDTSAYGGAIYGGSYSTITLSNNGSVTFSGNTASAYSYYSSSAYGGAIHGEWGSTITLSNNGSVTFSGNTAESASSSSDSSAYGGAIYGDSYSTITLSDNESVSFIGNTASGGYSYGGAIYTRGDLSIRNNDSVEFYQNAEVDDGSYRLRSIYASGNEISLSAAAGKNIEFRDSVYVGSGTTVNLNEDYTYQNADGESVTVKQQGDIIFTGATTVDDLYKAKGDVDGTEEEIRLSRTTEVNTMTKLYGGRLRVEDGAIYQGRGITAMAASGATLRVKDATLMHRGYTLTFNCGTTLELAGCNTITGSVQMQEGSCLVFDLRESQELTTVHGVLTLGGTLNVSARGNAGADNQILLYVEDGVSGWWENAVSADGASYALIGNYIVKNYSAASFLPYSLGDYQISSLHQGGGMINHYNSVHGSGIRNGVIELSDDESLVMAYNGSVTFSECRGGVIQVDGESSITLSNNDSVIFSENNGGVIDGSTITLNNNGRVEFSGNTGGVIDGSTITLNNNGRVEFSGNTGGAIDTHGDLSIRNNDSVEFYQNSKVDDGTYRLRSIYAGGSGAEISLSAAAGKSITFYDTVYIGTGATVNLNQDYTYQSEDGTSVTIKQQGDIVFTGAYAEQHLNDLLEAAGAGRTATAQELLNSRTTVVNAMTNLYGGRLRVEEGGIYQGWGITAMEGSGATVRVQNATLSHEGYDLTFNAGTALELAGDNSIIGNVEMSNGSVLRFDGSLLKGLTCISGNLTMEGTSMILLESTDSWMGENHVFLQVKGSIISELGSANDTDAGGDASFSRVKNLFVWNYNEGTFNPFFMGSLTQPARQTDAVEYYNYDKLEFSGLTSSSNGGAISATVFINWCNDVEFSSNTSYISDYSTRGGAINGNVTMVGNNKISFIGNRTNSLARSSYWSYGGAIDGDVLMSGNGEVSFIRNSAGESGGAICGSVSMSNNERVCFIDNAAKALSSYASGGAVYGSISLQDNDYVIFESNSSEWSGGALYVAHRDAATLSGNSRVEFIGNKAYQSGGAIYGGMYTTIELSNNGTVLFRDNTAYNDGAIYTYGSLYIQNNGHVVFENNARERSAFLSLRSIYADGGEDVVLSFSSAAGKCIEFRDPIYVDRECTFNLNADYVDENGNSIRQQGDIIFSSAKTAVPDLNDGASSLPAALNVSSRTSEVNALVNLYGGTLRVESGAVFKGCGIAAHAGSDAAVQVKNATLNHTGYTLTFASGTSLKLVDDYKLYARSLVMNEGSSLLLDASTSRGQLVLSGDLTMNGNVGITLSPDTQSTDENLLFMYVDGSVSGWNPRRVTVSGSDHCDASDFTWIDHCLILNYNAASYKPHLFFFEQQVGSVEYSDYAGVIFGGSSADVQESAISAGAGDLIRLSNNDKVEFQCNVTEYEGGAIKGDACTIAVDDNVSVVLSGNKSEGAGGAIYGTNASTISLSGNTSVNLQSNVTEGSGGTICVSDGSIAIDNNGAVSVCENVADSSGGGLYGYGSSISLNNNGKVLFSGNTAAEGCGISGYDCQISVNNNEQIEFVGNICSSYYGGGVVICASSGSSVEMNGNGSVVFNGNYGASYGGAVFVDGDSSFMLKNNASVTFCGNLAEGGGAVYGGSVTITDNGNVLFSGNTAYDYDGGAIGATNALSIRNNDSVLFEKNLDVKYGPNDASSDAFYLRSIYIQTDTAEESREMLISAAQGKSVEFRDSVYISDNVSFSLNEDYVDASGKTIRQQGDIIFTGAYTEKHLAEMKGSSGTEDEIQNSRTSEVYTMTHLYGGRLRIEAGAIYKGSGMAVAENSGAAVWLRNAQMLHQGHNISFGKGTTFGLRGCNVSLSDNLSLAGGSSLSFDIAAENISTAVLTHTGTLTLGGSVTLNIGTADSNLAHGQYKLLQVTDLSSLENWSNENLKMGDGSYAISDIEWVDNTLCFNYSGQKLSDLPILPEIPESEIPDTPVTPDEPEIPDTPVTPDEPEIPDTPVTPDEPEIPDTPVTPDEPEIPDTPVTPDEPEIPDTPVTPDEPEIPDTPVTPDEPEIPDTPVTPEEPEIPDTPVTPDEPEIPDTPVTPDEPEIPDTPVTPDEPEKSEPLNPLRPGAKPVLVGGDIDKNTEVILTEKGNVTLEGKVNAGAITVNSDKNITFKSNKKKPGSLTGDGDLTKKGKGTLTLNDGNSSWTGDTYLQAGTIKVKGTTSLGKGDVYVQGGTLNLGSKAIANDIVQEKSAAIKSGKKFTGTYTLESGELQKGSTLNISKTATLESGTVNGTLSGNGKTEVTGKVTLGDKGKITTRALTLGEDATLTTSAKGLSSKTTTLSIGEDATLSLGGKMTVDSLKINGGTLKSTASKPAAITVKNNMALTDAVLTTNGKVTTNKLTLNESTMTIKGAKAQNLTVKQALTIGSGSALTLNGKLSAGSLTIKKDGMLTMTGSKPVTLKVKGALTLSEGSSIILNYSFVQGKTYKVLTFGSYSGSKDFYSIFGVEADDCTITNTGKALTLTVTGKWKPQSQQKAVSADAATPIVAAKPQANPVSDALVQANWGQLEASRAFVNAIANRSNATQLGNGERAVWASAIGSSSRHDTASGHNGADTNVSGGAFGLETQVGRASLFGMALGNSWTRVSAHGFGTIKQDTTHLGIYGQTNWRSGVTADWSAAYGRSESETMGSDWNQKHLQLDGRVSYNHELNARTQLSPFAGVQYYASDAAGIGTTDTGSLQNLRAEIGVAASHRTGKLGVYGEIALHQDLARNNPSVSMEGARYTGMNPGRTGINFTIGASYELTDKWSVNASYTGEFVENANAHSANVGASYKF